MTDFDHESRQDAPEENEPIATETDLEDRLNSGANWFYWVAGLSVVNSITALLQGDLSFFIGLGATQVVDGLAMGIAEEAPELGVIVTSFAIGMNLFVLWAMYRGLSALWEMKAAAAGSISGAARDSAY